VRAWCEQLLHLQCLISYPGNWDGRGLAPSLPLSLKYNPMSKQERILEDKTYKLTRDAAPLSFILQSRSSKRRPLLYFDGKVNRPLRYAANQKSPFLDEQDNHAIVEPIIFEDGFLRVSARNPVLQEFLVLHPDNGSKFVEVNKEQDAQKEVDMMFQEADALAFAKGLGVEELETVARVVLGRDITKMTTAEIRRDVMVAARRNPSGFLDAANDPTMELQANISRMFEQKILSTRNSGRDIHFNLKDNKRRLISVPHGVPKLSFLADYFRKDEGLDTYKFLEQQLLDL
jgi:hypothetical protein